MSKFVLLCQNRIAFSGSYVVGLPTVKIHVVGPKSLAECHQPMKPQQYAT